MKLFTIDAENKVDLNLEWIRLIPAFRALFKTAGNKVLFTRDAHARKLLTYIYFMMDFSSPLSDWTEDDRHREALRYAELEEQDVKTEAMKVAMEEYESLLFGACRPLKTFRYAQRGMDAMDTFIQNISFTDKDKQGKLLYTPNQFNDWLKQINAGYDNLNLLRTRVDKELKATPEIRGSATLGDKEGRQRMIPLVEKGMPKDVTKTRWTQLDEILTPMVGTESSVDEDDDNYVDLSGDNED